MRRLAALPGIPYDVTSPACRLRRRRRLALGCELTLAGGGADQCNPDAHRDPAPRRCPKGEALERFAATGATLAIHLSVTNLGHIVRVLTPHYGADCPVVVAYRVSWPDQQLIRGTLADLRERVKAAKITCALVLVGPALAGATIPAPESRLYAPANTSPASPLVRSQLRAFRRACRGCLSRSPCRTSGLLGIAVLSLSTTAQAH